MIVREATYKDVIPIVEIGMKAATLPGSSYEGIEIDERKCKHLVATMSASKQSLVLVAERKGKIHGFLLGMTDELFFSRKKYATDVMFYVGNGARGSGAVMIKRFIEWAKNQRGVVDITMGISSGTGDPDRIGGLYESLGLIRSGGVYSMQINQDKVTKRAA